jgi:hypothetical protein
MIDNTGKIWRDSNSGACFRFSIAKGSAWPETPRSQRSPKDARDVHRKRGMPWRLARDFPLARIDVIHRSLRRQRRSLTLSAHACQSIAYYRLGMIKEKDGVRGMNGRGGPHEDSAAVDRARGEDGTRVRLATCAA